MDAIERAELEREHAAAEDYIYECSEEARLLEQQNVDELEESNRMGEKLNKYPIRNTRWEPAFDICGSPCLQAHGTTAGLLDPWNRELPKQGWSDPFSRRYCTTVEGVSIPLVVLY